MPNYGWLVVEEVDEDSEDIEDTEDVEDETDDEDTEELDDTDEDTEEDETEEDEDVGEVDERLLFSSMRCCLISSLVSISSLRRLFFSEPRTLRSSFSWSLLISWERRQ